MSALISYSNLGDREFGSTVILPFTSHDTNGSLLTITGGSFRVIELQTKSAYSGGNLTLDLDMLGQTGVHRALVDTNNPFFREDADYIIQLVSGTVGLQSQAGAICGVFSIGARSEGLVLRRTIKCHSGQVTLPGDPSTRRFRIDFEGVNDTVDNYYARQEFVFQSGGNAGVGQVCLSYDASEKEVLVQEAYPVPVETGARFVIVPHERELRIYTTHNEVEFGIGQGEGDRFSVTLMADGQAVTDPGSLASQMHLQTWDYDTDTPIDDEILQPAPNSGIYRYQGSAGLARKAGEGVVVRNTYQIDGKTYVFSRTIFNFV